MTNSRHPRGGLFIGILITVIGVIFLLDQLEVVHASYVFQVFWPVILIGLGLSIMLRTMDSGGSVPDEFSRMRSKSGHVWGTVLLVLGGVWLLNNLAIMTFPGAQLWPLWIVAAGVWWLLNRDRHDEAWRARRHGHAMRDWWRHHGRYQDGTPPPAYPPPPQAPRSPAGTPSSGPGPNPTSASFAGQETGGPEYWANQHGGWGVGQQAPPNPPPPPGAPGASGEVPSNPPPAPGGAPANSSASMDDTFEHSIAFMAFKRRITTQHFRYAKLSAVFGGFHLDFTMAEMEGNQAVILIDAVFGGGEIRVPPSWRVTIDAHAFGGAFMDETYARPDATAPAKTLIIRGSTVFGGVVIKN